MKIKTDIEGAIKALEVISNTSYETEEMTDPALDENGNYPGEAQETARDRLLEALEQEKSDREWQLSKYDDSEIKAEYLKRNPF